MPDWTTHLGILQKGEFIATGRREKILSKPNYISSLHSTNQPYRTSRALETEPVFDPILELNDGKVQYGDTLQFSGFDWILRSGEHTLITGPNGAGKSTCFNSSPATTPSAIVMIQKYSAFSEAQARACGRLNATSGWFQHHCIATTGAPGNAITTVVSGFFDSIGLYQKPNAQQLKLAAKWLSVTGLENRPTLHLDNCRDSNEWY